MGPLSVLDCLPLHRRHRVQPIEAARTMPTAPTPEHSDRPNRAGTRLIGGYFECQYRSASHSAAERNTTLQELLRESLNALFEKYGKSRIA